MCPCFCVASSFCALLPLLYIIEMPNAVMPSSFRLNALYFVCIMVANVKVVVSFVPVPAATARDVFKLREHPLQVRLPAV